MSEILPQGWLKTSFSTINFYKSKTIDPRNHPETEYELYSVPSFPSGEPEVMKGKDIGSSKQVVETGDVLVCKINPRINRVWQVGNNSGRPQIASSEWIVLKPNHLSSEFLRYQFTENKFRELICTDLTGVGGSLTRAQPKRVATFPVLLAPFGEQKRIVEKLDCLLAKVDACKARLDKVPEIIKRFRQSVLADAVSGKLTEDWRKDRKYNLHLSEELSSIKQTVKVRRSVPETVTMSDKIDSWEYPKTWVVMSAAELLKKNVIFDLKDGNHGSNHPKREDFSEIGLPFITAAHVNNNRIDYDGAPKISGKPLEKLRIGFAKKKDVILTHKGTVGRVAINNRDCVLTPQTTYYRIDHNYIKPEYLMIFLLSPKFQSQLDEIKSQTTRDFVPVTAQYSLFHLLPPIEEQNEIVSRVESLFTIADQIEAKLDLANKRVNNLTASILSKAFRGELVPQDPSDEPAEVLLDRIRAERESLAPGKKRSGRKKKIKPQKTDLEAEPEPAAAVTAKSDTDKNTKKQPTGQSDPRFEKSAVLQAFRKAVFHQADLEERTLLQLVGRRLGVHRLSPQIRGELESHIRTAIRRKIISRNGHGYNPATPTIHHYEDEDLIKTLRAVIRKGYEYEREYVATQTAAYLGFDNISEAFAARMKTIFNMAIRRGELYRNGVYVGKV